MNQYTDGNFYSYDSQKCDSHIDNGRSMCNLTVKNMQALRAQTKEYINPYNIQHYGEMLNFRAANINQFEPNEFHQKNNQERYCKYNELMTNFQNEVVPLMKSELDSAQISEEIGSSNKIASIMAKWGQNWKTGKMQHAAEQCRRRRAAARIAMDMQDLLDDAVPSDDVRLNSSSLNEWLSCKQGQEMGKRLNDGMSKFLLTQKLVNNYESDCLYRKMHQGRSNNRRKVSVSTYDNSDFGTNAQKVFLGGLPYWIVESSLRQKLAELGYIVINKPRVLRGFCPEVCLRTVDEAQSLINKGKIMIDGWQVDVRQYQPLDHLKKKLSDDIKRSVFLGGLRSGTTGQIIKNELKMLGMIVVNHPIIKAGFTPQVILADIEQAEQLVRIGKVRIFGALVDIRPYVATRERVMYLPRKDIVSHLY